MEPQLARASCAAAPASLPVPLPNDLHIDGLKIDNAEGVRKDSPDDRPERNGDDAGPSGRPNRPGRPGRPGRRRPDGRRMARARPPRSEESSSDTGNDDCSAGSDDFCIYTYRGADPPFGLGAGPPPERRLPAPPLFGPGRAERPAMGSGASSPDMDYLEMDFDPSSPCEQNSGGVASSDADSDVLHVDVRGCFESLLQASDDSEVDAELKRPNEALSPLKISNGPTVDSVLSAPLQLEPPNAPNGSLRVETDPQSNVDAEKTPDGISTCRHFAAPIPQLTANGRVVYVKRTSLSWPAREVQGHHSSSGDLVSPGEACEANIPESFSWNCFALTSPERGGILEASRVNLSSDLFHCTMAKKLIVGNHGAKFLQEHDTSNVDGEGSCGSGEPPVVPKCMVWSEREACSRQVTQIGTSACGATAIINVLLALQQEVDVERVTSSVNTIQRANNGSLCQYVISRAIAGCGVDALRAGLHIGSGGSVYSRHFSTWPEREISLSHWLAYWIGLGAVPIATLNLQAGILDPVRIPDSWHHQMIFGVGPRGIYMANPVDCVEEGALWHQLCSDSVLLIKGKDILSRWTRDTDLSPLMNVPGDERWKTMNVLGQIVNMIRESQNQAENVPMRTTHIKIPACYSAGITIAVLTGSEAHKNLLQAPELPLLSVDE